MILYWKIRYLDTRDRKWKDRTVWLPTAELDDVTKAAVEATVDLNTLGSREMLRFRHLFSARPEFEKRNDLHEKFGWFRSIFLLEYFEDENGKELTQKAMALALFGDENFVRIPPGAKQHDIDYIFSQKRPLTVEGVTLSDEQLQVLAYFVRDWRELIATAFYKEGPGSLHQQGDQEWVSTAVSDEEIRSFVTVFRRLYMENEPANFLKAAAVVTKAITDHPLITWLARAASEYEDALKINPSFLPGVGAHFPYTHKLVIDVFLYTQYAHQPNDRRLREFQECLAAVGNKRPSLTFLFHAVIHNCSALVANCGKVIAAFFNEYCKVNQVAPQVVTSAADAHPGIGTEEKKHEREARVLEGKTQELAKAIWKRKGEPPGGHTQFIEEARRQLRAALQPPPTGA